MKLTLLSKKEYTSMILPDKFIGRYWIRGCNTDGKMSDIISVEAVHSTDDEVASHWVMRSNRRFKIVDKSGNTIPNIPLDPLELYSIQSSDNQICSVYRANEYRLQAI